MTQGDTVSADTSLGTWVDAARARADGRALRRATPASAQADVTLSPSRPTVVDYLSATNRGRMPELIGLRHTRMSASPFAFLRGTAGLMAADLAAQPVTGLTAQICGDAHVANFGLYGGGHGEIVMDLNDFDETVVGPWEWDLKRLAVSLVLAGAEGGVPVKGCAKAARHAARSYRAATERLAEMPFLQSWTALGDEAAVSGADADALLDDFARAAAKASANSSARVAEQSVQTTASGWRFVVDPPLLAPVEQDTRAAVIDALSGYAATLHHSRQHLIARYQPCDVALRVVGTGSVGLRCYVVLLRGNADEALVLQVKQALPSALADSVTGPRWDHEGERIVHGARLVQADTDLLLGWTTIGGHQFIVRQFRNRKGAIDPTALPAGHLDDYGRLAGALLARAHARSLDPRLLDGYCRDYDDLDRAISDYALAYADQTRADHAVLLQALDDGLLHTT